MGRKKRICECEIDGCKRMGKGRFKRKGKWLCLRHYLLGIVYLVVALIVPAIDFIFGLPI